MNELLFRLRWFGIKLSNPKARIQVFDPSRGSGNEKVSENERQSETRLKEKGVEKRVICLERNDCQIVSLNVPEEA
jgi:hypothetical protein